MLRDKKYKCNNEKKNLKENKSYTQFMSRYSDLRVGTI